MHYIAQKETQKTNPTNQNQQKMVELKRRKRKKKGKEKNKGKKREKISETSSQGPPSLLSSGGKTHGFFNISDISGTKHS